MDPAGPPLFAISPLLQRAGVVHGFSLRGGGVSQGEFESLNLSVAVGDEAARVEENLSRLKRAAGLEGDAPFLRAHQVHGDRVLAAHRGADGSAQLVELFAATEPHAQPVSGETAAHAQPKDAGDALVAFESGVAVAVGIADCVPVLLAAPDPGGVAAVHSGWRGTRLHIAARGVRALQHASGAAPSHMLAAIGPCIGRCCYEVSQELALLFRGLFGPEAADDPTAVAKPHLDLRFCVARTLRDAGLPEERIEHVGGCTSCDAASWFSHRRDQGKTGRHLAFVVA